MLNFINTHAKSLCAFALGLSLFSSHSFAESGGVALGATRVIYPQGAKQTALPISNSSPQQRYLINSWVENAKGDKEKTFVVTPPLFVSEPKTENTLRIMYLGPDLPKDRESLFYLNVKSIPSVDQDAIANKNVLQLAILSRIKLFVRPKDLTVDAGSAYQKLTAQQNGQQLTVSNPTPYYITLVNVTADQKKLENTMISPKNNAIFNTASRTITFQTVNDYGALTESQSVVAQ